MSTKLIALDAGHGLKTPGKRTPTNIHEWELNDKVRDYVVKMLSDYDCEFIFPDKNEGNTDESLSSRKATYVNAKVDAAVSIHHNANTGTWNSATGVETYTDKSYTSADMKLAKCIHKNLSKYTGLKDRGIKQANFTVIYQSSVPAVLVEGGFMDGRNDYKIITSEEGQKGYAKAVAEGLIEFLDLKKKSSSSKDSQTKYIAHASIDENGKISVGSAGDQTSKEVCIRSWYNKPWQYVLRIKDSKVRKQFANNMIDLAKANYAGYDQSQRNTLLAQAKKVDFDFTKITTKCECDCSSAVTTFPVFLAEATTNSSSNGLIVWMLRTSASIPSSANFSAASNAELTIIPVATIVTSLPSLTTTPFPISNL